MPDARSSRPPASSSLWFAPTRASVRLLVAICAGAGLGLTLRGFSLALRTVLGWNVFALVLLSLVWSFIWRAGAAECQRRAGAQDPGRSITWALVLLSSTFSLFVSAIVLRQAHALAPGRALLWIVACLGAVVTSWLLTHTAWTLRYAHLYYRDDAEGVGGLSFPGDRPPDHFDFAYFAFTIGMCFQVSDVTISSPQIRRAVLMHACQSFAYNTAILALALNLAFGFVS